MITSMKPAIVTFQFIMLLPCRDVRAVEEQSMDVWKRSTRLSIAIYKELAKLRDFGFKDQITRSGLSIPSNIAEGFGRASDKDKRNFLNYAKVLVRSCEPNLNL